MHLPRDILEQSGWGLMYGLTIQIVIYPIELIKSRQQDPLCHQKCYQIAQELFRTGGVRAFYCGLSSKFIEIGYKQLWRWPVIMQLPPFLKQYGYNENQQQALTGMAIGTINSFFTTPWDGRRLAAIFSLPQKISWHGFPTYFSKNIIEWTTFLVAQNYFSNRQERENGTLHLTQSFIVALQTSICVSCAKSPLDVANTLRQTGKSLCLKNMSPSELLKRLYRGAPLSFSALLIYNFATTIFIDSLKHNSFK